MIYYYILSKVLNPKDKISLSQVNKSWQTIEGLQRSSLTVSCPNYLPKLLPRLPNLITLQTSKTVSNAFMQFIARTCPKIQVLVVRCREQVFYYIDDFDEEGVSAIAKGLSDLRELVLSNRGIENLGVASLGEFSRNLKSLDLRGCSKVSDEALESVGSMNCLETLDLEGCRLITDLGLGLLTKGSLCKVLKELSLAECDQITDTGLVYLTRVSCLETLNLAKCGSEITDVGGESALAKSRSLRILNLSRLYSLSNATMVALARNCRKLEVLNLTGCRLISIGTVLRALFSNKMIIKDSILESY